MADYPRIKLPSDGRFGAGPSKVRDAQVDAVVHSPLGTSHRKAPVREIVRSIQDGLAQLFHLPSGYEVLLGNGGATALWDAISFCLVQDRAQAAVIGSFSGKAAQAVDKAPWLKDADIRRAEPGTMILNEPAEGIDAYLYAHNETSTGATSPLVRYGGSPMNDAAALTIVDATSIAGGIDVDPTAVDFYYFSPQKCFGSDGGLWVAFASPAALARIERLAAQRWVPDFLNLQLAVENSRKNQTLNTPAIATLAMLAEQVAWMNASGGLPTMHARAKASTDAIYAWADAHDYAQPFVADPQYRSPVVATIDFDSTIDAPALSAELRRQGIVDIDPYRSLGRNQFRISAFPSIETSDVLILLEAIEALIESR
ncbi:MAG: phosphoserine transaminase [Arcanobacterium sp.]|nr:phosphoserine transaminase [Arcanobacterium sp.]